MATVSTARKINALIEQVFDVVAHIENFSKAVPHITDVEFLTDHIGERERSSRRRE